MLEIICLKNIATPWRFALQTALLTKNLKNYILQVIDFVKMSVLL